MIKNPALYIPGIFRQLNHFSRDNIQAVGVKHFGVAFVQPDNQLVLEVVKVIDVVDLDWILDELKAN